MRTFDRGRILFTFVSTWAIGKNQNTPNWSSMRQDAITWSGIGFKSSFYICWPSQVQIHFVHAIVTKPVLNQSMVKLMYLQAINIADTSFYLDKYCLFATSNFSYDKTLHLLRTTITDIAFLLGGVTSSKWIMGRDTLYFLKLPQMTHYDTQTLRSIYKHT